MKRHLWTLANAIMLLMFVLSTVVQFNDPDPVRWVSVYGVAAVVCGLELRRRTPALAPAALAVIAILWAASIAPRAHDVPIGAMFAEWEMKNLRVEEAREMYGLTIVAVWMIVVAGVAWRRARRLTALM